MLIYAKYHRFLACIMYKRSVIFSMHCINHEQSKKITNFETFFLKKSDLAQIWLSLRLTDLRTSPHDHNNGIRAVHAGIRHYHHPKVGPCRKKNCSNYKIHGFSGEPAPCARIYLLEPPQGATKKMRIDQFI